MQDRLIDKVEQIEQVKNQDYEKAYRKLEEEKEKSKDFLKIALS